LLVRLPEQREHLVIARCELENSADPALRALESRTLPVDRVIMLAVEALRP
jgi:hypothetical protein